MEQLISIIVPIYNAESTLDRCICALIGQTHQNIEIILINDGSKDRSLEICRQYESQDPRIRVIDKPNGGVSSARNAGLDIARGEFVMFCDSDDWAEPDWCQELISHYEEGCLVMCGHYVEGEQSFMPHAVKSGNGYSKYPRNRFFALKLKGFNAPWNKLYSAAVIRKDHLRFHENLSNGEDYVFNLQYLNGIRGDILFLDKCVFHYEWPREQSLSKKVPENYLEQCCLLSNLVLVEAERLGLTDIVSAQQLMTDFYNEFQKVILSVLNDPHTGTKETIVKLTNIMSTTEYRRCAAAAHISPNPVYTWLARRKNGLGIWLWHHLR